MKNIKSKKDEVITFRLSSEDFAPYKDKLAKSNMSRSAFFREAFINLNVNLIVNEKPDRNYIDLLRYYNKSSNNFNQIAKNSNKAFVSGQISEKLFTQILYQLNSTREILLAGLNNNADKVPRS